MNDREMFEKSFQRPSNFFDLSGEEQWAIDKSLGLLDWTGEGLSEADKLRFRAHYVKHQPEDLLDVAKWLNVEPENLKIKVKFEPLSKFLKQIKEMYATYDEFPDCEDRTNIIAEKLRKGEPKLPIYVEENDPHQFVMEGRHRMVAFWLERADKSDQKEELIPVAYVSKIELVSNNRPKI